MTLIFHHALKDLRAERWLVAVWTALLLTACAVEALKLEGRLGDALFALSLGRVVLGWLIAVRIVHADPLDGTTAFWLTRPLSPRMLLAAKAIALGGLLLGVPGIAALAVFVANGFAYTAIPGFLAQWLAIEALLLLPVVLVATLTRDVARLVLTMLVGVAAWWSLQASCRLFSMNPAGLGALATWHASVVHAWLVIGAGAVVLCSVLVARQYLTRRTGRIAVAALVATVGVVAVAALWPIQLVARHRPSWDELERADAGPAWSDAGRVTVSIQEDSLRVARLYGPSADLVGRLQIDGLAANEAVALAGGRGNLRFIEDGTVIRLRRVYAIGLDVGMSDLADAASRRNLEGVLGTRFADLFPSVALGMRLMAFSSGAYDGRAGSRASYDADLVFDAYRIAIAAEMPLTAGTSRPIGDVATIMLGSRWDPKYSRWFIDIRHAVPRLLLSGEDVRIVRFLRNRARGVSVVLYGGPVDGSNGLSATWINTERWSFAAYGDRGDGAVRVDAEWLRDADVVFVSFERIGRFARHVTIPEFAFPQAQIPKP